MKEKNRLKKAALFLIIQLLVLLTYAQQKQIAETTADNNQAIPKGLFKNVNDYGFMWWEDAISKTSDYTFNIKTNHYILSFNCENLELKGLGIVTGDPGEEFVLRESQAQSSSLIENAAFGAAFESEGNRFTANGIPVSKDSRWLYDNYRLIESGKYFHRRFLRDVVYQDGAPARDAENSGIEIVSWPDRLLFMQCIRPVKQISKGVLELSLDLNDKYSTLLQEGSAGALVAADGTGYVFMAAGGGTLAIDAESAKVVVRTTASNWTGETDETVGLIVYPVAANAREALLRALGEETAPLSVSAYQLHPEKQKLNVNYDEMYGWFRIEVLDNVKDNAGFAQSHVMINNAGNTERQIRLNFDRINNAKIPGVSMILRDKDGNPLGIPVQVSKNWHGAKGIERYKGTWLRGFSMLSVPANTTTTIEIVTINGAWGSLPAASASQLCLIGWGGNQQWNQSALGNWGETITYDADRGLNPASLCDMRATFINDGNSWGPNLGGAKFFSHYTDPDTEDGIRRTRTQYHRCGPNMTEVTYASASRDNRMDNEFTAIEYRCDDLSRGIYRIRLDVRSDVQFYDYIFFQLGATTYHQGVSNTLAWGNKEGLIKEWTATNGGDTYFTPKVEAKGALPWFSFQDTQQSKANRGFVIRSWKARINGVDNTPPYWAEHGTPGNPTSIINIVPPPNVTGFKSGDYVEAEIELIMLPTAADGYYGSNNNLKNALAKDANTWKMVYREVLGNDIEVLMTTGTLQRNYPIQVKANLEGRAQFKVKGGMGFVPLTVTGLNDYRDPLLEEKINGSWVKIDQSTHGKDFWQTNYINNLWEITFNIDLDNSGDIKAIREFRFSGNPKIKQ